MKGLLQHGDHSRRFLAGGVSFPRLLVCPLVLAAEALLYSSSRLNPFHGPCPPDIRAAKREKA
eukprot:2896217-Pyramimonas_sp.AAC.1